MRASRRLAANGGNPALTGDDGVMKGLRDA